MRSSSALARAPTTSPPPPTPITRGRREPRRIASASPAIGAPDRDRGVELAVLADDPTPVSVSQDPLVPRLRGRAVFELDVDPLGVGTGEQLLLQRLPVGGVVDVVGDVALGGPEGPADGAVGGFLRDRMAQPGADAPGERVAAVDGDLALRQRHRAPLLAVEMDPERDGL